MSNLVIVAIPDENDRVWKVSSDKIPHCTLLFLGDSDEVSNVDQIVQFVEHAANTTLNRFYLPVDRRGELGADKADVLFFRKGRYDYKAIRDFRSTLLQDNNIKTAHDTAGQHDGPWIPHLTLGYPENPAKPDDTDRDFGFYDVSFTKIAVWVDDFDGPEFLLKDWWDDWEALETVPMDVAMSDIRKLSPEDIAHFGVKGMKWGVRKAALGVAKTADNVLFELGTNNQHIQSAIAQDAHKAMKKNDLPAIKTKHTEYNKLTDRVKKPLSKEARAYRADVKAAYLTRLEESANTRTNFQGNRRYTLTENGKPNTKKYRWRLKTEAIQHADALENLDFTVQPVFDDEGYIVDFEMVTDEVKQSVEVGEDFIAHFGIKGMRWGQRKPPPDPVATSAKSQVPHGAKRKTKIQVEGGENHPAHEDAIKVAEARAKLQKSGTAALSNAELREVANRLQLENQVAVLSSSKGKKFVEKELENSGKKIIKKGARTAAPHVIKRAAKGAATVATTAALL